MSLKSEAKKDAGSDFANCVGKLENPPTYSAFMAAVVPELNVARKMAEDHMGNEYHEKYYTVLAGRVNEFCQDHHWPTTKQLLEFNPKAGIGEHPFLPGFVQDQLEKLKDLSSPYGEAVRRVTEAYAAVRKHIKQQQKALDRIVKNLGDNPSFEEAASKLYGYLEQGDYGGIVLDENFESMVNNWLIDQGWPHRYIHQRLSGAEKEAEGLDPDFYFDPTHPTGYTNGSDSEPAEPESDLVEQLAQLEPLADPGPKPDFKRGVTFTTPRVLVYDGRTIAKPGEIVEVDMRFPHKAQAFATVIGPGGKTDLPVSKLQELWPEEPKVSVPAKDQPKKDLPKVNGTLDPRLRQNLLDKDGHTIGRSGQTVHLVSKDQKGDGDDRTWVRLRVDKCSYVHHLPMKHLYDALEPAKTKKPGKRQKAKAVA